MQKKKIHVIQTYKKYQYFAFVNLECRMISSQIQRI